MCDKAYYKYHRDHSMTKEPGMLGKIQGGRPSKCTYAMSIRCIQRYSGASRGVCQALLPHKDSQR